MDLHVETTSDLRTLILVEWWGKTLIGGGQRERQKAWPSFSNFAIKKSREMGQCLEEDTDLRRSYKRWEILEHIYMHRK